MATALYELHKYMSGSIDLPVWILNTRWWIYVAIASFGIWLTQIAFKKFGLCLYTIIFYLLVCVFILSWAYGAAYQSAGNFKNPFFLSIIVLSVLGTFGTMLVFKEKIFLADGAAIILGMAACYLITLNH